VVGGRAFACSSISRALFISSGAEVLAINKSSSCDPNNRSVVRLVTFGAQSKPPPSFRATLDSQHKGATLQVPGWVDNIVGHQPFPVQGTDDGE
jgi:hypothetical protein